MKEYLSELVRGSPTPAQARNVTREYLQARILGCLQRAGAMIPLAFHGGTALRFLFASARYSEDLDFALEQARTLASSVKPSQYDFRAYLRAIQAEFAAESYVVQIKVSDQRNAQSALVRFPGLLYELGLSPHRYEMLSVKIEVDANPPAGAVLTTSVVRRHVMLQLQHYDRASLLSGKLHAILQRPYVKGRDFYDLLWYLSDPHWPAPNLVLLNNALQKTDWTGGLLDEGNWREAVRSRLQTVAWERVVSDVRPFLEPSADPALLTFENMMRVLG
jgi:hypothetical protein